MNASNSVSRDTQNLLETLEINMDNLSVKSENTVCEYVKRDKSICGKPPTYLFTENNTEYCSTHILAAFNHQAGNTKKEDKILKVSNLDTELCIKLVKKTKKTTSVVVEFETKYIDTRLKNEKGEFDYYDSKNKKPYRELCSITSVDGNEGNPCKLHYEYIFNEVKLCTPHMIDAYNRAHGLDIYFLEHIEKTEGIIQVKLPEEEGIIPKASAKLTYNGVCSYNENGLLCTTTSETMFQLDPNIFERLRYEPPVVFCKKHLLEFCTNNLSQYGVFDSLKKCCIILEDQKILLPIMIQVKSAYTGCPEYKDVVRDIRINNANLSLKGGTAKKKSTATKTTAKNTTNKSGHRQVSGSCAITTKVKREKAYIPPETLFNDDIVLKIRKKLYKSDKRFIFGEKIGTGSFGSVYIIHDKKEKIDYAIKLAIYDNSNKIASKRLMDSINAEYLLINSRLTPFKHPNIEELVYGAGVSTCHTLVDEYAYMLMKLYNEPISEVAKSSLTFEQIKYVGVQLLNVLETIHSTGNLYNDLKPDNILLKDTKADMINENTGKFEVVLVDFGVCTQWRNFKNEVLEAGESSPVGTDMFASINSNSSKKTSRVDDIECLIYILLYLHNKAILPWSNATSLQQILRQKTNLLIGPDDVPTYLSKMLEMIKNHHFQDKPNYNKLKQFLTQDEYAAPPPYGGEEYEDKPSVVEDEEMKSEQDSDSDYESD